MIIYTKNVESEKSCASNWKWSKYRPLKRLKGKRKAKRKAATAIAQSRRDDGVPDWIRTSGLWSRSKMCRLFYGVF